MLWVTSLPGAHTESRFGIALVNFPAKCIYYIEGKLNAWRKIRRKVTIIMIILITSFQPQRIWLTLVVLLEEI